MPREESRVGVVRAAWRVAAKELRISLRDRQTLVYSIVLPLALYPALFWAWIQGSVLVQGRAEARVPTVAVVAPPDDVANKLALDWNDILGEPPEIGAWSLVRTPDDPHAALRAAELDLVLSFTPLAQHAGPQTAAYLHHDATQAGGKLALRRVRERLQELQISTREQVARERGVDPDTLEPFAIVEHNLASERDMGGFFLSFLLPLTFVLMTTLGAFLPAVDTTAGERERGTIETTLTLPVPRAGVQLGKLLAVAVLALFAALLNLAGMSVAARGLLAHLPDGAVAISVPAGALLAIVPYAILFALFVSAVLVAVASTASTFRQGQAHLGTVQLLFVLPAAITVMPGIELTSALAPIPVVGVTLAFKSLLQPGAVPWTALLIVGASLAIYAALALWIAARVLSSEQSGTGLRWPFRNRKLA